MKLRTILLLISLLAVLSAVAGGSMYYSALRESAFTEADRRAATRIRVLRKTISSLLSENIKPVRALAGTEEMLEMLIRPNPSAQNKANAMLDLFKDSLNVDVCYLMNYKGDTIASSNRDAPDSFVGKNFAFRPYFQQAIHSAPATYLALGVTSKKRGAYYSYPVFEKGGDTPIGLAVIKVSIDLIEKELGLSPEEFLLVADPSGVVFISNRKEWLYSLLKPLPLSEIDSIAASRQFGKGPWKWSGLNFFTDKHATDKDGERYLKHIIDLENHPGWQIIYLRSMRTITQTVVDPIIRITGPIVLSLCGFIGLAVFMLYRKARMEILERHKIENALRESEERYRNLYHHTPAMLHSIDTNGKIVSISNYWSEVMGYRQEEVIGQELTRFFTAASEQYAREKVFPQFFQDGFCRDIPYQFVKRNGDTIDVLLSAIADRDRNGKIIRTLAVSIDITERKRTEEQLQLAKEELSQYSKDLERKVLKRTREIHNILTNTPSVIYMKDNNGRYTLVNTGYETLFGLTNEDVHGKTDSEVLPEAIADQFRHSDDRVLSERRSHHVEEHIQHADGEHTYLSVKFPIFDDSGNVSGICGILNDITAVKKAQNQLRRLSGSIMANQEKERAALARELHDELGQVLTALRMDAVWLQERLKTSDRSAAERALTMCQLIDKEIEEVRGMTFRLRPGVLDDLGLVDALEWYTTDFERRTEITCIFDHSDIPDLTDNVATAAYRISQEALTNVARHAFAGKVAVRLQTSNGTLILTVNDDGRGFNAQNLPESEGLGIAGMRERAMLVGGSLEVHTEPGAGTQVFLKVPLGGLI